MTAATKVDCIKLYLALELGEGKWKLAMTPGSGQRPRIKNVFAGDIDGVLREIAKSKRRFELSPDTPTVSCYEAGRDGFWIHRELVAEGIDNVVVDSSSIEVDRRQRRAKSDRLDAEKLVSMLFRFHLNEPKIWRVVRVPTPQDEDGRRLNREQSVLRKELTAHSNRIVGLLATLGIKLAKPLGMDFDQVLERLSQRDGSPIAPGMKQQLLHEWERWKLAYRQLSDNKNAQRRLLRRDETLGVEKMRLLMMLRGIGLVGAWTLARELGCRTFQNGKQVGAFVGLTPTPYDSGNGRREQGISKAGSRRLRAMMIELAWGWVRYQPDSAIAKWFRKFSGETNKRSRKIGIVAVARKLVVALWKFMETGEIPEGAVTVSWESKVCPNRKEEAQAVA